MSKLPALTYLTWMTYDVIPDQLTTYADFDIQGFLESKKSFLATYQIDGVLYSQWLAEKCKNADINPKIILIKLQNEQSITTMRTQPSDKVMNRCLGFAMTDSGDNPEAYGFKQQHILAISWWQRNLLSAKQTYQTVKDKVAAMGPYTIKSYFAPSLGDRLALLPHVIVDNSFIHLRPLTAMTYVLYSYTPWTGDTNSIYYYETGETFGVFIFWEAWKIWWPADLAKYEHTMLEDVLQLKEA